MGKATAVTLSYCAEQARRFDNDRFLCSLFAPESCRESIWGVLALNLELARLPEMVQEPILRQIRLAWWRERIDEAFAGHPANHDVLISLAQAVQNHGISRCHIDQLVDGRGRDLDVDPVPDTVADLMSYVDATSVSVTRLVLEVLNARTEPDVHAAGHVGMAWGLVGLMRAVPFHARHSRSYIPRQSAAPVDFPRESTHAPRKRAAVQSGVKEVIQLAINEIQKAREMRSETSRAALPALLPATIAEGYVNQMSRSKYDPYDPRLQRPAPLKAIRLGINRALGRY